MEKEFIPYEQALAIKELGFDKPCFGWYNRTGKDLYIKSNRNVDIDPTTAPTFSQAFRWFREKYDFSHSISKTYSREYIPYVNGTELNLDENCENVEGFQWIYKTYEEAELGCLKKLIEIVKKK